jgi:hypothetical protein
MSSSRNRVYFPQLSAPSEIILESNDEGGEGGGASDEEGGGGDEVRYFAGRGGGQTGTDVRRIASEKSMASKYASHEKNSSPKKGKLGLKYRVSRIQGGGKCLAK